MDGRRTRRGRAGGAWGAALVACGLAAATLGGSAQADPPEVTTTLTPNTLRLADEENRLLAFVNKPRAALCTPGRYAFEATLIAWFDGGMVGDPPPEPASSQEGVVPLTWEDRVVNGTEFFSITGNAPVEVWRLEDDVDGVDCTATDGAGSELFATGDMELTFTRRSTVDGVTGDNRLSGVVTDTTGRRWNYTIRYPSTHPRPTPRPSSTSCRSAEATPAVSG
jgi:hypothetical protein